MIAFRRWNCAPSKSKNRQRFTRPVLRSVQLTSLLEAVWAPGFALFSYRLGTSRYSLALCWSPTSACWKTRSTRGIMFSSLEYANIFRNFPPFLLYVLGGLNTPLLRYNCASSKAMSATDTKTPGDEKFPKLSFKVLHVEKCFTCTLHIVLRSVLRYTPLVLW